MRTFWIRFVRGCWLPVSLFSLVGIVSLGIYFLGDPNLAAVVSKYGTYAAVLSVLVFIVIVGSKNRWPNNRWLVRLHKVVTFSRDRGEL